MVTAPTPTEYPMSLSVDYPERLDRLATFFRAFTVIPIAIVLSLLTGNGFTWTGTQGTTYTYSGTAVHATTFTLTTAGFVVVPVVLMLLFRRKYPRWWFDWNVALLRFSTRVSVYAVLLRDEYPSTDEEQAVHIDALYPDANRDLNRWLPLVKWFLAIPHYVILFFLGIAALVVVIIAWFAILFTGRYPRGMFDFVVGVTRWSLRVTAYALLLSTDHYPPFSLD